MKFMRSLALSICAVMFAVTGCSKGSGNSTPESVVMSYFGALKAGEISEGFMRDIATDSFFDAYIGRLSPEKRADMLSQMNAWAKTMLGEVSMQIEEVTVTGDTAIVNARMVGGRIPRGKEAGVFELKLVNGAWKLNSEDAR